MKAMKKIWGLICLCISMLAFGFGITLTNNVVAKAATAQNMSIGYAVVEYSDGTPSTYTFVLNGIETPETYDFYVYIDGQKVSACAKWNNFYINHEEFDCEVGDSFLLTIPAGTYYQSNTYVAQDYSMILYNQGGYAEHGQDVLARTENPTLISTTPYSIDFNYESWAMNASNAGNLYLSIENGSEIPYGGDGSKEDWSDNSRYNAIGSAVFVNGVGVGGQIVKTHASEWAYIALSGVATAGDVITVKGWFNNTMHGAFCVEETNFVYDGKFWEKADDVSYDLQPSATTDSDPQNGFYLSMAANDIPVSATNGGWSYRTVPVASQFYGFHNGEAKAIQLAKFSANDWYIALKDSGITAVSGDTITVGGWFYCTDANGAKTYIKINTASFSFDGAAWTRIDPAISVSLKGTNVEGEYLYVFPGEAIGDVTASSNSEVAVVYEAGAVVDGKFALRSGESASEYLATFSVKDANGSVYRKKMTVRVGVEDFLMEEGAAVRVAGDNVNGLRFSAEMSADTYTNLKAQGASFGIVIVPKDYITAGYELTASNLFGANAKYSKTAESGAAQSVRRMLLLDGLTPADRDNDGKYEIYGAITDILTNNLTREFVGVAYANINGTYIIASYYGDDMENNARSIYYVSQRAVEENDKFASAVQTKYINAYGDYLSDEGASYKREYTVNYVQTNSKGKSSVVSETFTANLNATFDLTAKAFDGYTLTSPSMLKARIYANKENVFNFYYKDASLPDFNSIAWYHPTLDPTNDYMNDTNRAIAETIRDAGFTHVSLSGGDDVYVTSAENIAAVKKIINMFWTYGGLKSVTYSHNSDVERVDIVGNYNDKGINPDFSDCEGFGGFLVWDEPAATTEAMNRLAEYAAWYNSVYGASEMPFMVNLYPSYAGYFTTNKSGDYTTYPAYVKAYCDIVLSQVTGTKYLSMDSYPIMADGTLQQYFMYDLAVLKAYSVEYDAIANVILQGCGWNGNQNLAPTEEQMRFQLYTALAFGMDSISWWGYAPNQATGAVIVDGQSAVKADGTKNTDVYNAIQKVNGELATFGPLYKTYDWQGVIMSSPSKGFINIGKDAQYEAFNKVKNESVFSKYLLSASNTDAFSSVSGSGSNYVMSVMKDKNNNEAFAVVNYSAVEDNKTLKLTLKTNVNGQYIIYTAGGSQTVDIKTGGYTLTLAPGQGAFIVSASTAHTVTFKNWDGTVLQESTCELGATPTYTGATPTRNGYTFAGWSPALGAITGDTTYTATFVKQHTVTFVNGDGTSNTTTQTVGDGMSATKTTPTLDGYIFKEWLLDGEAYDFNSAVTEDITLVASWYKAISGEKSEISATYIHDNSKVDVNTTSIDAVKANGNASWYFDSDYVIDWKGTADRQLDEGLTFSVNGSLAGEHYITLPKLNYALYSKVDFAFFMEDSGGLGTITLNGVDVTPKNADGNRNRLFSIITDGTGTYAVWREVNSATADIARIELPASVINGSEGLTFDCNLTGYVRIFISEFHVTKRALDYKAEMASILVQLPENANDLTGNSDEIALANAYSEAEQYMTEYEAANYVRPAVIVAAKDFALCQAVIDAAAGSNAQLEAIEAYRQFANSLSAEDKASEWHQTCVAAVNVVILENYYEEVIVENDPTVDTSNGAADSGERIQTGWGGQHTGYNTSYETYVHMVQFNSGNYDGIVTLPKFNYNASVETYFGLFAITGGNGTITIGGQSFSFDSSKEHYFKVMIKEGVLTMTDDSKANVDGGATVITTTLSTDVLNGTAGLAIDFQFNAWSQAEITEMRYTRAVVSESVYENDPNVDTSNGASDSGERIQTGWGGHHTEYNTSYETYVHMMQFNSGNHDGVVTLDAFNYNAYDEVYFGLFAITTGNGTITIGGQSFSFDSSKGHSFKVMIKDGVLTVTDDSKTNNDGGATVITVALSANVLNGTAGLVIDFQFDAWSQAEITEMHASTSVKLIS